MRNPDRKRGILTKDDRDYLIGRKNLGSGSERNTRRRIRQRVTHGLYDFEYLSSELSSRDLNQIITDSDEIDEEIFQAAEDAIAFIFQMCLHAPNTGAESTDQMFRKLLLNGIEKALSDDQKVLDFKLDLSYGLSNERRLELAKKVYHGEALDLAELREALNNDYFDDSFIFEPLDSNGFPKSIDPEDTLSHDDYSGYPD